jgi:hypothetical protein
MHTIRFDYNVKLPASDDHVTAAKDRLAPETNGAFNLGKKYIFAEGLTETHAAGYQAHAWHGA